MNNAVDSDFIDRINEELDKAFGPSYRETRTHESNKSIRRITSKTGNELKLCTEHMDFIFDCIKVTDGNEQEIIEKYVKSGRDENELNQVLSLVSEFKNKQKTERGVIYMNSGTNSDKKMAKNCKFLKELSELDKEVTNKIKQEILTGAEKDNASFYLTFASEYFAADGNGQKIIEKYVKQGGDEMDLDKISKSILDIKEVQENALIQEYIRKDSDDSLTVSDLEKAVKARKYANEFLKAGKGDEHEVFEKYTDQPEEKQYIDFAFKIVTYLKNKQHNDEDSFSAHNPNAMERIKHRHNTANSLI